MSHDDDIAVSAIRPARALLLQYTPKWSSLRRTGNSTPVKLTVLIPLVGYLIIFNEKLIDYLALAREFAGTTFSSEHLSVSPRLLIIYFGLCFIALGSAIYSRWCPEEVKHYGTSAAYVGGDGPSIGHFALEPIEHQLRSSSYQAKYMALRNRFDFPRPRPRSVDHEREDEVESLNQAKNGILHLYFYQLNNSRPFARLLVSTSFAVGFLLLLVPSAQIFARAVALLFRYWTA